MEKAKENKDFYPNIAILPGETIKENMVFYGMNQKELSERLGITTKHLCNIINGKAPITYETALNLQNVFGPRAEFWMNLETNYQLTKTRLEEKKKLEEDIEILKEIPYKKMLEFNWIKHFKEKPSKNDIVELLRSFFGVASLKYIKPCANVMYKKHNSKNGLSDYAILAWLRKAELNGQNIEVDEFNKTKLKKLIPQFRELTLKKPEEFYPKMVELCASCGIVLTLVKDLPKTYICGATIWRKNKAILALSVRGKRADIFWFTFFHELAHLIYHKPSDYNINYDKKEKEESYYDLEKEADIIASNYLIPKDLYENFVNNFNYKDKRLIIEYSKKIGIAPCILVGRLLHDNYLTEYSNYSDLRPSFEIV